MAPLNKLNRKGQGKLTPAQFQDLVKKIARRKPVTSKAADDDLPDVPALGKGRISAVMFHGEED